MPVLVFIVVQSITAGISIAVAFDAIMVDLKVNQSFLSASGKNRQKLVFLLHT
jgi:hypothetical protein